MLTRRRVMALALAVPLLVALPASALAATARLNPNTATKAQLAGIAGLPADLAAAIRGVRPFPTMVEFNVLIRGTLNADQAEALYEQLFIPINLNTAKRDEIALIPGMSSRMVREFLEYRPYANIEVFNKEIGKYVDDAEVARLRSYVTL